jgi:hypothetical protein
MKRFIKAVKISIAGFGLLMAACTNVLWDKPEINQPRQGNGAIRIVVGDEARSTLLPNQDFIEIQLCFYQNVDDFITDPEEGVGENSRKALAAPKPWP